MPQQSRHKKMLTPLPVETWGVITLKVRMDNKERVALEEAMSAKDPLSVKSILNIFKQRGAVITNLAYSSDGNKEDSPFGSVVVMTKKTVEVTLIATDKIKLNGRKEK